MDPYKLFKDLTWLTWQ